ncbi:MAG TPA: hypothetical protein DCP89_03185 [Acidimicrobiaceae bacterium]|nr:hypothetical protein [Actinomycetota bacterium]NCG40111.1 PaaI family thioesterase [Actinomycetota bacterium]HAN07482.1 hypothetical protein [Acidimicrobiaceae bacterium]
MKVSCLEITEIHALALLTVNPDDLRPGGFISGPDQFRLADAVLWFLTFGAIGRVEEMSVTTELSIRFLRPAIGKKLYARADLEVKNRRSVVGSVYLWCDDTPSRRVSTGQGTYALPLTK